jgi:hypothetical protein
MNREQIYSTVFAFFEALTVGGAPLFKTATRTVKTWDAVLPEDTPSLLMQQRAETNQYRKGLPPLWRLQIELYLYAHTGGSADKDVVATKILNPLLDAVEAAIHRDDLSNYASTLGLSVSHCAIEGNIEIFQGDLGDEAVALIPITVLVP